MQKKRYEIDDRKPSVLPRIGTAVVAIGSLASAAAIAAPSITDFNTFSQTAQPADAAGMPATVDSAPTAEATLPSRQAEIATSENTPSSVPVTEAEPLALATTTETNPAASEVVAQVPPRLLTDDAPLYEETLDPAEPETLQSRRQQAWDNNQWPSIEPNQARAWLDSLLSHPNIANPSPVFSQYDRHVRNNTQLSSEANTSGVIGLRNSEGKPTGQSIAATVDGRSWDVSLNPQTGAAGTVAEAARNLVCVGAQPLAVTNNLNFGDPEKPDNYYHLAMSVKGMGQACTAFGTPVTGGNVSLYNEHGGSPILPSPVIGMVGLVDEGITPCPPNFTCAGDAVMLLGEFNPALGGSQYQQQRCGHVFGEPPAVNLTAEKTLQDVVLNGHTQGWWRSAADVSIGGLAVTLAEACMPTALTSADKPVLGVSADVAALHDAITSDRLDTLLFGQTHGSVVVSVAPKHQAAVQTACKAAGLPVVALGHVTESPQLSITQHSTELLSAPVNELYALWASAFGHALGVTH